MNVRRQRNVPKADLLMGEFNNCEHVFIHLEPGKMQTVSCRLPSGEFVTFSFIPGSTADEFECVDIHSTVGQKFKYKETDAKDDIHFVQHAIGFSRFGNTIDTRKCDKPTSLITLLLGKSHHAKPS